VDAHRIRFLFKKQRGSCRTIKAWEEFDSVGQDLLLEGVSLHEEEVPVIGGLGDEDQTRTLITTKRIYWRSNECTQALDLASIAKVNVPEFSSSSKHDLHRLWLVTHDGGSYQVDSQPGEAFFVLWNLLLQIITPPKPGTRKSGD
jgi:hypothetical protein